MHIFVASNTKKMYPVKKPICRKSVCITETLRRLVCGESCAFPLAKLSSIHPTVSRLRKDGFDYTVNVESGKGKITVTRKK